MPRLAELPASANLNVPPSRLKAPLTRDEHHQFTKPIGPVWSVEDSSMKRVFALALLVSAAVASQAVTIAQWNFNSVPSDANTATGTTAPSTGAGVASLLGGVTGAFNSGDASGGSSDPATGDDSGWQTTNYPAQSAAPGTAGVQFAVSTAGFSGIAVSWDTRHSNTSSRYTRLDYSLDGGANWINSTVFDADQGGDKWYNGRSVDLSGVAGASNNANFQVRIVSVFAPGGGTYSPTTTGQTYAGTGTLRYDMVTISGQPVPEPATLAILGMGAAALIRRRAKKA